MLNSDQVAASILEINRKKYILALIKTVIFYAAAAAALVFTAKSSDILHPSVSPVPFFSVLIVLLIIPILRYRLYRVFTRPSFTGVITSAANINGFEPRTDINIGTIVDNGGGMSAESLYAVTIEDERGRRRRFVYSSAASMGYARPVLLAGTRVRYAFGGRYPWSEETISERPFCPNCGQFGAGNETHCSCGCLYLKEEMQD